MTKIIKLRAVMNMRREETFNGQQDKSSSVGINVIWQNLARSEERKIGFAAVQIEYD